MTPWFQKLWPIDSNETTFDQAIKLPKEWFIQAHQLKKGETWHANKNQTIGINSNFPIHYFVRHISSQGLDENKVWNISVLSLSDENLKQALSVRKKFTSLKPNSFY